MVRISKIYSQEVLDSRGNPTIKAALSSQVVQAQVKEKQLNYAMVTKIAFWAKES